MQKGDTFESLAAACEAIKAYVLNQGELFKTVASDKKRYIIRYKDEACEFRIRATRSTKEQTSITVFESHSCTPATHYKAKQSQSVCHLADHHRAAIIDNRDITATQLRLSERLGYSNNVSYLQAYRTIKAVRREVDGNEAESFGKFVHYGQRIEASDLDNYYRLRIDNKGYFQAFFCALAGLRNAIKFLRRFIGLDGTHTSSRYRIQLLIAGGIDANDYILLLAYSLVPIECKE
jgi:hypothetical protein